jgi:DNA-binding transcriptional LysR family regulator
MLDYLTRGPVDCSGGDLSVSLRGLTARSMLPDLVSLALFVRIAETSSITKAAESSFIALAAASRRIALLERRLDVELLYRTPRGVELTLAGNALLSHARQILSQVDRMRAELSDYVKGIKGLVRIQASTWAIPQFLLRDLASLCATFPDVKIGLEECLSANVAQSLRDGTTDIGIIVEGTPTECLACFDYRTDHLVAAAQGPPVARG